MTMYTRRDDGTLQEIPAEHAKVLEQYRDSMPVVFEIQECGPPMLYPLIDVDEEPYGTPQPGHLEYQARRVSRELRLRRLDEKAVDPNYEQLAYAALRAYVADIAVFTASCCFGDGEAYTQRAVKQAVGEVGRKLSKAVERAVRDAMADTRKTVAA